MTSRLLLAVSICSFLPFQTINAQTTGSIVPDGKTQTTVTVNGNVTGVTTSTTRGINAYNSFTKFNVNSGTVANLYLPTGTANLLNLVSGSPVTISGILNSIKNGQIGGNVFFIDPFGMVLGKTGVINIGSLTVLTPTQAFTKSFFDASGNPSDVSTAAVLSGTIPITSDGLISVIGRINAIGNINLTAGSVVNAGNIGTGAVFVANQPNFADIVNVKGIQTGSQIVASNGDINIVATQSFENSGTISAQGVSGVNGGNVGIQSGGTMTLDSGSRIDVSGVGANSNAGSIQITAAQGGLVQSGAVLAASGGNVSGNGGMIELSGSGTITLAGGTFDASAVNGTPGTMLLDPNETDITGSVSSPGTSWVDTADSIYVYPGVTISTTPTTTGSGTTAGSITLQTTGAATAGAGPTDQSIHIGSCEQNVSCGTGATILDASDSGGTAGNVTIAATSSVNKTWDSNNPDPNFNTDQASASVIVGSNSVIKGHDISITANATTSKSATITEDPSGNQTQAPDALSVVFCTQSPCANGTITDSILNLASEAGFSGGVISKATSDVEIGGQINATGNVAINSVATSSATFTTNGLYLAYAESDPSATAKILGGADIQANGDFTLNANATNNLTNTSQAVTGQSSDNNTVTQLGPAVNITYSKADTTSVAGVELNASVGANNVTVGARNTNAFDTEASPNVNSSSGTNFGAGVAVVIADTSSSADAHLNGTVNAAGDVASAASSVNTENKVSATAVVTQASGQTSNTTDIAGFTSGAAEADSSNTAQTDNRASFGGLGLSAAVAIADSTNSASSTVGFGASVTSSGATKITADASDTFKADASGSASGSNVDLSGAVAVTNYSNSSTASVGSGATVNATGQLIVQATAELPNPSASVLESAESFIENLSLSELSSDASQLSSDVSSATSGLSGLEAAYNAIKTAYDNAKNETTSSLSGSASSSGSGAAVAGVVEVMKANNSATAFIGSDANVTAGSAAVTASATTNSVNAAGSSEAQDSSDSDQNKSGNDSHAAVAAGATYSGITYTNSAIAYIDDGASVKTTQGDLDVQSTATNFMANKFASGESAGSTVGLSGAISNITIDSTSEAYIGSQATVNAAQNIYVDAENSTHIYQIGDNSTSASTAAVGIVLGFMNLNNTTEAYVEGSGTSSAPSIVAGGNLTVNANSYERLMTLAASSVSNSNSSTQDDASGTSNSASAGETSGKNNTADANPDAQAGTYSSSSGFGVSGDIAFNNVNDTTESYITGGVVSTTGQTTVTANDTALMLAVGGGLVRANTGGLQGSFVDDKIDKNTVADISGVAINTSALEVQAKSSDVVLAASAGGAGSQGSNSVASLAGSYNGLSIANTTEAYLDGATVRGSQGGSSQTGTVDINAANQESVVSIAGAISYGSSDLGVGVGLDMGSTKNTVEATVDQSSDIASALGVNVTASDDEGILSVAADLAVQKNQSGGAAIAASVSYQSVDPTVIAEVDGKIVANGNITVAANDDQGSNSLGLPDGVIAVAGSLPVSAGQSGAGLGASGTISLTGKIVEAIVGNGADLESTAGDVNVTAATSDHQYLFAFGGTYGETAGFMGSAVVNINTNTTEATVGNNATVKGDNVNITASDTISNIDGAGGFSLSGTAAVGAAGDVEFLGVPGTSGSSATPLTVSAMIGQGANVTATNGNVDLSSTLTPMVYSIAADAGIAASGSSGADMTVIGAGSVINSDTQTSAISAGNVTASSGNFTVNADRDTTVLSVAGQLGLAVNFNVEDPGPGIGVGASVAVENRTDQVTAAVTGGTDNVSSALDVLATGDDKISAVAAGAGISSTFDADGAAIVNLLDPTTIASIGGASINPTSVGGNAQSVTVQANSNTDLPIMVAGSLVATLSGLGAAVDVTKIGKTTDAEIQPGTTINSGGNITVVANSEESGELTTISASAGFSTYDADASVIYMNAATTALVDAGSTLNANNNVQISALDSSAFNQGLSSIAFAPPSGSGSYTIAAGVADITKTTTAEVDGSATALGEGSPIIADNGSFDVTYTSWPSTDFVFQGLSLASAVSNDFLSDKMLTGERSATPTTQSVNGLAVTSVSTNDFNSSEVGSAAGAGLVLTNTSTAQISNTNINTGAGNTQSGVLVVAATDVGHVGAAIGVGGVTSTQIANVNPAADVTILTNNTFANITGTTVNTSGAVGVTSNAAVDDVSFTVGLSLSGFVNLAASLSYMGVTDITEAYVTGGSLGTAQTPVASIAINATDTTNTDIMAGGGTFGGIGSIGAAIGITEIDKTTDATLGGVSTPYSVGATDTYSTGAANVTAQSFETMDSTNVAGSLGSLLAGVAGGVSVESDQSATNAIIGIGTDTAGSVNVQATNTATVNSFDGSLAGALVAGAAGSVDVGSIQNSVEAAINNANVTTTVGDVNVDATETRNITSDAFGGTGAVGIGLQASVIDWGVSGAVNQNVTGSSLENTVNGNTTMGSSQFNPLSSSGGTADGEADSQIQSAALGVAENVNSSNAGAQNASNSSTSALNSWGNKNSTAATSAISASPVTQGTTAQIDGGTISSAQAVGVNAADNTTMNMTAGGVSVGGVGSIGASVDIASVDTQANASILGGATVSAVGTVTVDASRNNTVIGTVYDGSAGIDFAGGAAVAIIDDTGSSTAEVGATIHQANSLNVTATTQKSDSTTTGGLNIALGLGAGYAYAKTDEGGTTTAELDGNTTTSPQVQNIAISASDTSVAVANTTAITAGIVSLGGAEAYTDIQPSVIASVDSSAQIQTAGNFQETATGAEVAISNVTGVNAGGATIGIGADIAGAITSPTIEAVVGGDVNAGGNVTVAALFNTGMNGDGLPLCVQYYGCYAQATSTMTAGSLLNAGTGAEADATSSPMQGVILWGAQISSGGDVNLQSLSSNSAYSNANASSIAALDFPGNTIANATAGNYNVVDVISSVVGGNNVAILAQSWDYLMPGVSGSADGLFSFQTDQTSATANANGQTSANLISSTVSANATQGAVNITAQTDDDAEATGNTTAGALILTTSVNANAYGVDLPSVSVDSASTINASTVTLTANLDQAIFSASATSVTEGGNATANATTDVEVSGSPTVTVDGKINAPQGITINALVNSDPVAVDTSSSAEADFTAGISANLDASATNNTTFSPTVTASNSATLTTDNLTVEATSPLATGSSSTQSNSQTLSNYSNSAIAHNDSAVTTVADAVEGVTNDVVGWIPGVGSVIEDVVDFFVGLFEDVVNNSTTATTAGKYTAAPAITLNATIVQPSSSPDPNIVIAANGNITSNQPASSVTTQGGEIVVNLVNQSPAVITLEAPGGSISGTPTVVNDTAWTTVNVTNNSSMNMVVNNVEPLYDASSSTPQIKLEAGVDANGNSLDTISFNFTTDQKTPTPINITNNSATANTNIYLAGNIFDPSGSVAITADMGSILQNAGANATQSITANNVSLTANHGNIGTQANPLNIDLYDVESPAATATLSALAGQNLYLNLTPIEIFQIGDAVPSSVAVDLNSIEAGSNIGLNLNPAIATVPTLETETFNVNLFGIQIPISIMYWTNVVNTVNGQFNLTGATAGQAGQILAGGNVTISAPTETTLNLQNGSLIQSGFENIGFTVNQNGSWTGTPIPVNYASSIDAGTVVMQDMQQQGGTVTIAGGGALTGNGTIDALKGYSNVSITNSSDSNLEIGNMNYTTAAPGVISIFGATESLNGTYTGSNTSIALTQTVNMAPAMNITQNGAGDVDLNGQILVPTGTTTIASSQNIVNMAGTGELVDSNAIHLTAASGQIGSSAAPIYIQDGSGAVNASATGNIVFNEVSGPLNVGTITSSGGNVDLTSAGSIQDANGSSSLVSGNDLVLISQNGAIGSTQNSLPIIANELTAKAIGDVDINALEGTLSVDRVTSQNGNVILAVDAGDLDLGMISAASGDVTLSASGSILNDNSPVSAVNITAESVSLTASTGGIGASSAPLVLDSSSGTQLTATAANDVDIKALNGSLNANQVTSKNGSVDLTVTDGDLNLGTVTAVKGNVVLTASGSILNHDSQTTPNIVSAGADLTAGTGSIGAASAPLLAKVSGTLNALANTNIFITQSGDLTSQWITSTLGNITLDVLNGNANIQSITAPQTIDLTVNGTLLNVGLIKAWTINVDLTGKGGIATFNKMIAGRTVNVTADQSHIRNFAPMTWGGPVYFGIYVTEGGFNLGPMDPGVIMNWNMGSQQYQDWLKRIYFRYSPMPKEKLVTDLTARQGKAGEGQ